MKPPSNVNACAAIRIKSGLPVSESHVKELIDQAFADVKPQKVITVTTPRHVAGAVASAQSFLSEHRDGPRVLFLIVDLILFDADLAAVVEEQSGKSGVEAWRPGAAALQDRFSYYGELPKKGRYRLSFGRTCLYSVRILQLLWKVLDRRVIVIFNAGNLRIDSLDLAVLSARLASEGVSWIYTQEDERYGGASFISCLRLLCRNATGAPWPADPGEVN
jgi:hypothetical protein